MILRAVTMLCGALATLAGAQHAIVDAGYSGEPGRRVNGVPHFATIGAALLAVPANNDRPFLIFIKQGRYDEKLIVDRPFVHFLGENRDSTIISHADCSDTPAPNGGRLGMQGSFTLQIAAPDFRAENLTIANGFDYPANAARAEDDPAKVQNPQAVALMTTTGSDRAVFCNCVIKGFQDTLFADAGRHYFHACRILGHVDFIFGAGQAVFENCEIVSRDRPGRLPTGFVTAPSTAAAFPYGFLFLHCRLLKETPALPGGSVCLGRPWHPAGDPRVEGSAVFIRCFMDDHLGAEGYAPISIRDSTGQRLWFEVKPDSRFFEFESHGPGAIKSARRPTLNEKEAAYYTAAHVLNGWQPVCSKQGL
ncbi:MAG: pectinesterase family protein [candidate division KSB1 bacterium]|nr:pectinesterase family protein [candidate division KSB1 bacterium]MDZ7273533.1 pectinesterase family protein [candidate division KSB1 bacterium]MDZ7286876.1 pectinesterase family protein [candidate division KSB1 bacterium]MDZ7299771.1 pectinesterase family protein [candidate division KSB1 bacterium]MDZ7307653.1 pectinesterase family protein [candidate division KSB1 bacterium]